MPRLVPQAPSTHVVPAGQAIPTSMLHVSSTQPNPTLLFPKQKSSQPLIQRPPSVQVYFWFKPPPVSTQLPPPPPPVYTPPTIYSSGSGGGGSSGGGGGGGGGGGW